MGLKVRWDGVSENHQGVVSSDILVVGESDTMTPTGSVEYGLRNGTMASISTSVWEKAATLQLSF